MCVRSATYAWSMLSRIDLRAGALAPLPRASLDVAGALAGAAALIDAVRDDGAAALTAQAERFDRVRPESIAVPQAALRDALDALQPELRAALETAIARVREASAAQVPLSQTTTFGDGAVVEQRWMPVARAGVYVPGGKAVLCSSVVMNVVAAQAAGVTQIALASPAQADHDGLPHPAVLGAAALLGVDEVYAMGGAGAIGALAYGVSEIGLRPVDVVTGPGNVYVAAAKRLVAGRVRVDAEAGPTEIVIIADRSADPDLVAADLVSQAEHDELAAAVLVTDDVAFAGRVDAAVERIARETQHAERVVASLTGEQSAIVLVDDMAQAVAVSNEYAPEHLEIMTTDDDAVLSGIRDAGAIFVGPASPVSLGDYAAGSNHVLPTGGQARHTSGLSASVFLRPQQIVRYDLAALREVHDAAVTIALAEDLPAHAAAIRARF